MNVKQYIKQNKKRFINELFEFLRIPSVSAQPGHAKDMRRAAGFVKEKLKRAGADKTEICPTGGHPAVYGEKIVGRKKPTVLVYGHYDVQPPDPLGEWKSPPFEPVVKNGKIYARGASDDKGQMYAHIKAFEYLMAAGGPPCNVKFLFEGEEEGGADSTEKYVFRHAGKLKADMVLASDSDIIDLRTPSITNRLRGISYVEVEVTGPDHDLHSGVYGGAVVNPANALCAMIARLHDKNGRVAIPRFYDNVDELSAVERRCLKKIPFDAKKYMAELGVKGLGGEAGYGAMERATIRPTLDVNGIWSGYTGDGSKTVIPSRARAKISMRLVPRQDPEKIIRRFRSYFKSIAPRPVRVKIIPLHAADWVVVPTDSSAYRAAEAAYRRAFGKNPLPMPAGGSIPIVSVFEKALGAKTILAGFGLASDRCHSPNENFGVWNYLKAVETIIYFYEEFSSRNL